jgi:cytochrome c oxidase assembly protein subunit 11
MSDTERKNLVLARKLAMLAVLMFGFGYALVPLYDVLCEWTGQNSKKTEDRIAEATQYTVDEKREVMLEFLASVNRATPMSFEAETPKLSVHPGQYYDVRFKAKNLSHQRVKIRAVATFSPGLTKDYVTKVICFCELEQIFNPDEEKSMTVRLAVKPDLPERYNTITLSYTLFDITNKSED